MEAVRLLVCGGRSYKDHATLNRVLDGVHFARPVSVLIEGEALGADTLAREWAEARGIPVEPYPADWAGKGRAAGPIRNRQMLTEGKPDEAVAFFDRPRHESRGTANMVGQLSKAGIPVILIGGAE